MVIECSTSTDTLGLPRKARNGRNLPNARLLSLFITKKSPKRDRRYNTLVMQMGQFIDHDIAQTPSFPTECCDGDKMLGKIVIYTVVCLLNHMCSFKKIPAFS